MSIDRRFLAITRQLMKDSHVSAVIRDRVEQMSKHIEASLPAEQPVQESMNEVEPQKSEPEKKPDQPVQSSHNDNRGGWSRGKQK